jgi:hypothetical protein
MKSRRDSEDERTMLFDAGWEMRVHGALIVWRKPGGHGNWYSQEVAIAILQFLEEEQDGKEGPT